MHPKIMQFQYDYKQSIKQKVSFVSLRLVKRYRPYLLPKIAVENKQRL